MDHRQYYAFNMISLGKLRSHINRGQQKCKHNRYKNVANLDRLILCLLLVKRIGIAVVENLPANVVTFSWKKNVYHSETVA